MDKLKSCPFCGCKARLLHRDVGVYQFSYVQCDNFKCGVKGMEFQCSTSYASDERAVEAWNRRADNV